MRGEACEKRERVTNPFEFEILLFVAERRVGGSASAEVGIRRKTRITRRAIGHVQRGYGSPAVGLRFNVHLGTRRQRWWWLTNRNGRSIGREGKLRRARRSHGSVDMSAGLLIEKVTDLVEREREEMPMIAKSGFYLSEGLGLIIFGQNRRVHGM